MYNIVNLIFILNYNNQIIDVVYLTVRLYHRVACTLNYYLLIYHVRYKNENMYNIFIHLIISNLNLV